jgi:hypothetical protein
MIFSRQIVLSRRVGVQRATAALWICISGEAVIPGPPQAEPRIQCGGAGGEAAWIPDSRKSAPRNDVDRYVPDLGAA